MAEGKEKQDKPLTPRQRAFVEAYVGEARFNGTEAARRAGYSGDAHALGVRGSELLAIRRVKEEVEVRMQAAIMPANEVLNRLGRHASASLADVLDDDGKFSLKEAKRKGTDDLLKKLKVKEITKQTLGDSRILETSYEYEIHDPQAALVHLGRYHKLFTDKTEVTGKDGAPLSQEVVVKIDKVYDSSDSNRSDRETGDSGA